MFDAFLRVHVVRIICCCFLVIDLFHTHDLCSCSFCLLFSCEMLLGRFHLHNNMLEICICRTLPLFSFSYNYLSSILTQCTAWIGVISSALVKKKIIRSDLCARLMKISIFWMVSCREIMAHFCTILYSVHIMALTCPQNKLRLIGIWNIKTKIFFFKLYCNSKFKTKKLI